MNYLIYQITNTKNGKTYIGCHQTTNPDDGYMGSGKYLKRAIDKHGIEAFTKTILHNFDSPEAMFAKEAELVNEEFVRRPDTYNINIGGHGGWDYVNASGNNNTFNRGVGLNKELRDLGQQSLAVKWKDPIFVAKFGIIMSKAKRLYYSNNPSHWIGKSHTPETIAKQKKAAIGRAKGSKNPLFGKKWMTNGIDSKPATKEEQESLISAGWWFGRYFNK